jgi:putative flippase GtrA
VLQRAKVQTRKLFSYKIVRYGIVGGISTGIHIGVASLYIYFVNSSLLQSNIIGFIIAYIFSYLMQSKHVFGHEISFSKAVKYFIVQFGSLLISIMLSGLFEGYNSYIKTILVVGFMPLVTFIVHKFWTFK